MEKAKKVLFLTQEIEPYVNETPLSTISRNLIPAVQETGREVRTFTPKWGQINERRNQLHEVIRLSGMNLIIDDTDHQLIIKVASINSARIQVYFIDNDDFMKNRLMLVDDKGKLYKDNVERVMFFARGSLETVKKLRWVPSVIHCQGVMSSLAPFLLKLAYYDEPSYRESKIVYTPTTDLPDAPLPKNFNGILAYREASHEALITLGELSTLDDLNRIGMFMSDGVILNEPNERYERMAKEMGKPVAVLDMDNITLAATEMYDRLWDEVVRNRPKEDDDDEGYLF
ncbi:MAG: glycogen/starch synthase [Bacteroidaceae bacterium]|jgi:starch synthase|nr:glycogen/starch synthase [Bacteroidaceae bacterium]MBQ2363737.1 glycogen/starch synthase [Bacteroidaceae bacterium]MBQ5392769.1 glycogen/starch synthase [Bacteroidaceae bacterium]MBQ5838447.1 glycogen/starch synthase [Bacteroidaceae bacterium]MBQ5912318.1 glycogen/starch synthase [Bacteroidaceae bacterium]